ncbi:5-methyltetrahydropteroyltriglutamate-- homocysteine methyltransferase [Pseudonocardia sp. Ae168_Ps1]|uniref:5-methyltetrahydropteroyltriglutamate-- homocysteine S-methyltransferase n=1 Tax=unclassified Pseudonocardia TaxID=2619320 RepID=UPI00094B616D|nr:MULTISPECIES: 5-methyltetrahydropteroyltriglutamate--homocysteine S-methyltransferase [unclassified Pseudonocardia]OLL74494.1 5-methyltetrahydropteroyltriglutamate-- homocysteine methyltransferase [Pseudonocardia sp. Ae150A_Ps1]OLL80474.1 5-methyltetrahydropteroyltriglutamate-- homocysteine methyltransferase [Pseudonocardia sp. Ae168_Ps1]OLL85399.1 5-methyltetrahydropteroyltriglutamate-- homocysteine methyltransferase [Pseudonocardia sp. Ae263_Ps1]OLL94574.1 5-methyltetrahydropteroyltrigluta
MTTSSESGTASTVLGYPRIGPYRELKRATEAFWAGRSGASALHDVAGGLRRDTWTGLRDAGLGQVPGNTFSFYDHVLDTALAVGAVPERFAGIEDPLERLFAMARGRTGAPACEMTKWFDTNYHYLVPEIGPSTRLAPGSRKALDEFREALRSDVLTRPVLVGPVTFLLLSKPAEGSPEDFRPLDLLGPLVEVYRDLLAELADAGAEWVQLDEPAFAADRTDPEVAALRKAYDRLASAPRRPKILVASYFGELGRALPVLASTAVEGLALDLVAGRADLDGIDSVEGLGRKRVLAGVVDGRNVWRTDLDAALSDATRLTGVAGRVEVSTSCSLLHVPYDLEAETALPADVVDMLAFARQKVDEVVLLGRALHEGRAAVADAFDAAKATRERVAAASRRDEGVRSRFAELGADHYRRPAGDVRAKAQREALGLPDVPTTTIGSFPQTAEIRKDRAAHRRGDITDDEYTGRMRREIERVVRLQEDIGLDVLVHGEPERNDMVQYFAENLDGFATTELGWVQSYGSRCVRPPILHSDVSRAEPITVGWATYAQSLSDRYVKGMLTGPVTILAWSFVRDDQPLGDTARQVGLALRDEVVDLEAAGIRIIQVDEPALRELLPLHERDRQSYLDWAVDSFRMSVGGVADTTQIHTHLCYSEFGEVVGAIDGLDADVTTVEAARSRMEVLGDLGPGVPRGLGPGVYDVHSPEVPDTDELAGQLTAALHHIGAERLWANPDCGLKTRGEPETVAALTNLVAAARRVRSGGVPTTG